MSDTLFNLIIAGALTGLILFTVVSLIAFISAMCEMYKDYKEEKNA
jgi:uncharacterized membrane protein